MNIREILDYLKTSVENVAIASVKSIKAHKYDVNVTNPVKVDNFPKTQKIEGSVDVDHKPLLKAFESIEKQLEILKSSIDSIDIPDSIEVKNFPKSPDPVKEVSIKNQPKTIAVSNLDRVLKGLQAVEKAVSKLPTKYPETKIPPFPRIPSFPTDIKILNPVKNVVVDNFEKLIGKDPKKYVPVRLSDGKEFYEAMEQVALSSGKYAFSDSEGQRGQALMDANRRAVMFLDEYRLNDQREIGSVKYLGYEDRYANWYIMKMSQGSSEEDQTFRFASNINNSTINTYAGAWNNKLTLQFDRYGVAFAQ